MARSSYSKPSVPNKGTPGPNTTKPIGVHDGQAAHKPRHKASTPERQHHEGFHTPGNPSSGQSGAGTGGRSDKGRNTPKPA